MKNIQCRGSEEMKGTDILSLVEAKDWIRLDYDEPVVEGLINLAYALIADSIDNFDIKILNENFKIKLKYCMSCSIVDMYDSRSSTITTNANTKEQLKLINQNALMQLKYGVYE